MRVVCVCVGGGLRYSPGLGWQVGRVITYNSQLSGREVRQFSYIYNKWCVL